MESKEPEKWLEKSEKDLFAAKINLNQELYDVSSFLSHQAAEKALKAIYILKFKRLWKIHDLKVLGEKVGAPQEILERCDSLNPAYIATRYPMEAGYDENTAEEAMRSAEKVISWAKEKLKAL